MSRSANEQISDRRMPFVRRALKLSPGHQMEEYRRKIASCVEMARQLIDVVA